MRWVHMNQTKKPQPSKPQTNKDQTYKPPTSKPQTYKPSSERLHKQFTDPQSLGILIRRQRKKKGYTIDYAAMHANCGRRFLSELERGKPTAEIGKVIKACRVAGVRLYAQVDDDYDDE